MDPTRVILGPVTTEKSERLKAQRTYTLRVNADATKVDIAIVLQRFFGVEVQQVRIQNVKPKWKTGRRGIVIRKRDPWKKALVTLTAKSRALDLANFKAT